MKVLQKMFRLSPRSRGFHLIDQEVEEIFRALNTIETGTMHLFLKHTSASLALGENADPSVRVDLENFFSDIADDKLYYTHTLEGKDDMPGHVKSVMIGASVTIPVTQGRLNTGIWQGVYLCEHRHHADSRELVMTIMGI